MVFAMPHARAAYPESGGIKSPRDLAVKEGHRYSVAAYQRDTQLGRRGPVPATTLVP